MAFQRRLAGPAKPSYMSKQLEHEKQLERLTAKRLTTLRGAQGRDAAVDTRGGGVNLARSFARFSISVFTALCGKRGRERRGTSGTIGAFLGRKVENSSARDVCRVDSRW